MLTGVKIAGLGIALPETIVSNDEIRRILAGRRDQVLARGIKLSEAQSAEFETDDAWIVERVGIRERRFAKLAETTSDYAAMASHQCWTDAYGDGLAVPDFLILGTVSPDHFTTPATSVITHRKMGVPVYRGGPAGGALRNFIARDVTQACCSFMFAFQDGFSLVRNSLCQRGIVCGADLMSRVMSWNRRSPFVILADAAGSLALERVPLEQSWFGPNAFFTGVNGGPGGEYEDLIKTMAGGAFRPTRSEDLDPLVDRQMMVMEGNEVFKVIVRMVSNEIIPGALDHAGLSLKQIDVLIMHQANLRMIEAIISRLLKSKDEGMAIRLATSRDPEGELVLPKGVKSLTPKHHVIVCYNNIDHFGNTTSASIPLCLHEARELGIIKPGKRVMAVAFGGGFSWASAIIEWGGRDLFGQ